MTLCRVVEMPDGSVRVMHPVGAANDDEARAILDRDQNLVGHDAEGREVPNPLAGRPFVDLDPADLPADRGQRARWRLRSRRVRVEEQGGGRS